VTLLEVKKTPDGRILARRKDRLPLTAADREEARRLAVIEELPPRAWVVEEIRYIRIYYEAARGFSKNFAECTARSLD
jgi:hypothetical protein